MSGVVSVDRARAWLQIIARRQRATGHVEVVPAAKHLARLGLSLAETRELLTELVPHDSKELEEGMRAAHLQIVGSTPPRAPAALPAGADLLEDPEEITLESILAAQSDALIKRVLHRGDAATLYGPSGSGKTFLALDLAWHVARGDTWHGHAVTRAPVLYLCLEGVSGFKKRLLAIRKDRGEAGGYFKRQKIPVSLAKSSAGEEGARRIIDAAKALEAERGQPVGLIVIDTYGRATAGDDENAADTVMAYMELRAGRISRETGAAVLTVAHPNRQGDLRGSLHLRNASDVILKADREGERRSFEIEKCKDDIEGPLFDYDLRPIVLGTDDDGMPVTSCVVAPKPPGPKRTKDRPNRTRTVFRAAFEAAKDGDGAAALHDVGAEFKRRWHVTQSDPKKAAAAKRQALKNAIRNLPSGLEIIEKKRNRICASERDGA